MNERINEAELAERLKPAVRVLQVIVAALAAGVLTFAIVTLFIGQVGGMLADPVLEKILLSLGILLVPVALVASRLVSSAMVRNRRGEIVAGTASPTRQSSASSPLAVIAELGDAGTLFGVYLNKTIVAAAILEGAAFVNLVVFLLCGQIVNLVLGVVMAGLIAAMLPTAPRVAVWIGEQLRLIDDERQLVR